MDMYNIVKPIEKMKIDEDIRIIEIIKKLESKLFLSFYHLAKLTVKNDEKILVKENLASHWRDESSLKKGTYFLCMSHSAHSEKMSLDILTPDEAKKLFSQGDLENVKDLEDGYIKMKLIKNGFISENGFTDMKEGYLYVEDLRYDITKKNLFGRGDIVTKQYYKQCINSLMYEHVYNHQENRDMELVFADIHEIKTYIYLKYTNNKELIKELIDELNKTMRCSCDLKNIKINDEGEITLKLNDKGDIVIIPDSKSLPPILKKASSLEDILDELMLNDPRRKDFPIEKPDNTINQKDILKIASKVKKIKKVDWEIE